MLALSAFIPAYSRYYFAFFFFCRSPAMANNRGARPAALQQANLLFSRADSARRLNFERESYSSLRGLAAVFRQSFRPRPDAAVRRETAKVRRGISRAIRNAEKRAPASSHSIAADFQFQSFQFVSIPCFPFRIPISD